MAIEAIYSFLFYHLSFITALFDSTWVQVLKEKINSRTLGRLLRDSYSWTPVKPPKKKKS